MNVVVFLSTLLLTAAPLGHGEAPRPDLDSDQVRAIVASANSARELFYRVFTKIVNGRPRTVVLLGETHLALPDDLAGARAVVDAFAVIATEANSARHDKTWEYKWAWLVGPMLTPQYLLLRLTEGRLETSPMHLAASGRKLKSLRNAERLHRPSAAEERALLAMGASSLGTAVSEVGMAAAGLALAAGPRTRLKVGALAAAAAGFVVSGMASVDGFASPLVRNRDVSIAKFIGAWSEAAGDPGPLLVILGSLHLHNVGDFLAAEYGFGENALKTLGD